MFGGRLSAPLGPVGVDVGTTGIRLLQLRQHAGELQVVGAGHVRADLRDPDAVDQSTLTEQIRAAVRAGGFAGRRCVVSMPRTELQVQAVRLPRMPESELRQAAAWEATQRFGFDHAALAVDYISTGALLHGGEGREELVLVAATHASLTARLEPIIAAGLRPIAVDTHFSAVARLFSRRCRREADQVQVRVVLEVGTTGSTVLILRGDQIAFCKPLPLGGAHFNRAVSDHLQLDEQAAAELRQSRIRDALREPGTESCIETATDRAVFEAVRPLMGDLAREVVLCLRYYGVTFRGHPPERIIVTGGEGLEPHLCAALEQTCKMPVGSEESPPVLEPLMPQIRAKLGVTPDPAACWAAAAGLSIRGVERAAVRPSDGRRGAA